MKRALDKISQFTIKVVGEWVVPPRKEKETTLLKTHQPKKQHASKKNSDFGHNTTKLQISGRTGWEGNLGLKQPRL